MIRSDEYYGGQGDEAAQQEELRKQRQQQALQAALVAQQNQTTPDQSAPAAADNNNAAQAQSVATQSASQASNGSPTTPTGGIPTGGGGYDFNQARANIEKGIGRALTDADISTAFSKFGGSPSSQFTDASIAPVISYFKGAGGGGAGGSGAGGGGGGPVPDANAWKDFINSFASQSHFTTPQLPGTQLPTYTPQQLLSQDALGAESQQFALLQRILQQPDQYTEQNVRQMQEAQKEQALASQQGAMTKLQDRYAGMGRSGSGQLDANARRMQDSTTSQILQGNRDVDLQANTANWNSRLSALQSANSVLNESAGRRQMQANQEYLGYNSEKDRVAFALQEALGQAGLSNQTDAKTLQAQQLALQTALGAGGLSMDQYKTDLGNNLNWYQALSTNDNFLKQLLANLSMFNTQQTNNTLK